MNFSFDVTMGAYDGAELCELIGLFLLSKIKKIKDLECGLYRGDVLSVSTLPNREKEYKIKKNHNWYFQQRQSQNNLLFNIDICKFSQCKFGPQKHHIPTLQKTK